MTHTTHTTGHVAAPRREVYRALLDPEAVPRWRVPAGMSCRVHTFEPHEGGAFRVSLTYDDPASTSGKSTSHTDTYHGRFTRLVPDAEVVEEMEFESPDPAFQGLMTITTTLTDAPGGGTDVTVLHTDLPEAVAPADNETGMRMALDNLARLLEHPA
ncbi:MULTISPECIES: SRPBCC domain-containing protein [unclassified Streptomyces]|uniref:SRPBCC domain-containing protein n=1 Tax=unclassified Streptomyces TaxID=2593676 RepID=UPI0022B74F0A|nr:MULTISPECIES: SRPBCC domain-containing protein [unclassified Streptomyces]MCZ7417772.1 SRPBCC domain-containing protein [Streptomyces sp. WMMC897]MCZ7432432.1 SRPBCC domain-containing protein [Streptomyces sp. WMMC1477]